MANPIRYTTTSQTKSLRRGNWWIGTGDSDKGPTSSTGFYAGIDPPAGGYSIYLDKASGGPAVYCPSNDSELIEVTNLIANASYITVNQCLSYFATQTDKIVVNRQYERVVTDGLVMCYDAGFTPSYPRNGTTLYDLSTFQINSALQNGLGYSSSNGGTFTFDGTDDRTFTSTVPNLTNQMTLECWYNSNNVYNPSLPVDGLAFVAGRELSYRLICHSLYISWVCATANNPWYSAGTAEADIYNANGFSGWNYVAGTYDGNRNRIYRNGELAKTASTPISGNVITNTGQPYRLGWPGNAIPGTQSVNVFNGSIAINRVYNRALSAAEILQNYNAQKSRFGL